MGLNHHQQVQIGPFQGRQQLPKGSKVVPPPPPSRTNGAGLDRSGPSTFGTRSLGSRVPGSSCHTWPVQPRGPGAALPRGVAQAAIACTVSPPHLVAEDHPACATREPGSERLVPPQVDRRLRRFSGWARIRSAVAAGRWPRPGRPAAASHLFQDRVYSGARRRKSRHSSAEDSPGRARASWASSSSDGSGPSPRQTYRCSSTRAASTSARGRGVNSSGTVPGRRRLRQRLGPGWLPAAAPRARQAGWPGPRTAGCGWRAAGRSLAVGRVQVYPPRVPATVSATPGGRRAVRPGRGRGRAVRRPGTGAAATPPGVPGLPGGALTVDIPTRATAGVEGRAEVFPSRGP